MGEMRLSICGIGQVQNILIINEMVQYETTMKLTFWASNLFWFHHRMPFMVLMRTSTNVSNFAWTVVSKMNPCCILSLKMTFFLPKSHIHPLWFNFEYIYIYIHFSGSIQYFTESLQKVYRLYSNWQLSQYQKRLVARINPTLLQKINLQNTWTLQLIN